MPEKSNTVRARLGRLRRRLVRPLRPSKNSRGSSPKGVAPSPTAKPERSDPLAGYVSVLPPGPDRLVVVLADKALRRRLKPWFTQFGADQLHVVSAESAPEWQLANTSITHHLGENDAQLHWHLKLLGPADVILDLTAGDLARHLAKFRKLFFHLKPGGAYVIDQSDRSGNAFVKATGSWLTKLFTAEERAEGGAPAPAVPAVDVESVRAIDTVVANRDLIVVTKRGRHLIKLRDQETNRIMAVRDREVDVDELESRPAGVLQSGATVISHHAEVEIPYLSTRLEYPALHLRHYSGPVAFSGSTLMYTEKSILPDSFRHHLEANPDNARLVSVSPTFGRIPDHEQPTDSLAGHYYQLDCAFSGHFGHLMTETVSRLWGWDRAKASLPELKALLRIYHPKARDPVLERRLFTAYGIDEDDIVWVDHPVMLESVVSATPMWHNQVPHYVHPQIVETYARLSDGLIDSEAPHYRKIFVSRASRSPRRTCRNADKVEAFFENQGFTIVYPETRDLGQQAAIFANAEVIAGFGGSALFNMVFARRLTTLIVLSHEAYTARNEHLFAALRDCTVHYFWSPPDIPHPENGWSQDAFYSDWEFDFNRNGADLEAVLADL